MGSDLNAQDRIAALMQSMGGEDNFTRIANGRTAEKAQHSPQSEPFPVLPETELGGEQPETDFWKEQPEPVREAEDLECGDKQGLRLQEDFRKENGYDWFDPPAHKIKVKGYRPPPKKTTPTPSHADASTDGGNLTLDSRCGEPAPRDLKFTPFAALCKFPYKFVSKEWLQPLATVIFDNNKIQNRDWDLYYVYVSEEWPSPYLFVTESQFQSLLDEINESFPDAHFTISQELRDEGLVIDFSDIETAELRPRWLGHSTTRDQTDGWPNYLEETKYDSSNMSHSKDAELFKQKMELAAEVIRNKKKGAKKAKQEQNFEKRKGMAKELTRAQNYLGLLPVGEEESLLPDIANLTISPFDPITQSPKSFMQDPIFIAIDVEAYERPPNQITEVGVATLDVRDLKDVPPGVNGDTWQGAIRARHFRIAEHKHLVNHEFVVGCPQMFEFGESETIGKDMIVSKLTSCFHAPFSAAHLVEKGKDTFGDKIDNYAPSGEEGEEKRNIIFLGHDVESDVNYLKRLGFDPCNRGNLLEKMDTRSMFQAHIQDPQPTSLGNMVNHFGFDAWFTHNGGNDAVYTVWALLAMAVASATDRGKPDVATRRAEELKRREDKAAEEARERVRAGAEGWEDDEDEVALRDDEEGLMDDLGDVKLGAWGDAEGVDVSGGKGKQSGFVPWQGSESGFYNENGYPIDV